MGTSQNDVNNSATISSMTYESLLLSAQFYEANGTIAKMLSLCHANRFIVKICYLVISHGQNARDKY